MARRTHTYAVRLAVEGGGQVKAELISVGQSGEQSLKRIESAGDRASGGLKGLGREAELLRTGIRPSVARSRAWPRSAASPPWSIARSRRPMPSARPPTRLTDVLEVRFPGPVIRRPVTDPGPRVSCFTARSRAHRTARDGAG
jgi:hypothetical protein